MKNRQITYCFLFLFPVHDFYSSHVHQMANQAAARQSPPEPSNHASSPISNPIHNPSASSYYHHYHHSAAASANQNSATNAGYSPPHNLNQNGGSLNGNESPNSVDQFASNNNNIQLPETPNSLVTTIMGPTSGNSNSNDGANAINDTSASENAAIISNNNNHYSPWCPSTGHHQLPQSNSSPIHSSSYNTAHHPSASLYSAHHNLSSTLIPHQNISSFAHPHSGKSFGMGMSQPFYSWY